MNYSFQDDRVNKSNSSEADSEGEEIDLTKKLHLHQPQIQNDQHFNEIKPNNLFYFLQNRPNSGQQNNHPFFQQYSKGFPNSIPIDPIKVNLNDLKPQQIQNIQEQPKQGLKFQPLYRKYASINEQDLNEEKKPNYIQIKPIQRLPTFNQMQYQIPSQSQQITKNDIKVIPKIEQQKNQIKPIINYPSQKSIQQQKFQNKELTIQCQTCLDYFHPFIYQRHLAECKQNFKEEECPYCNKTFISQSIQDHLRNCHQNGENKQITCDICFDVMNMRDFHSHYEECKLELHKEPCKYCKELIIFKYMEQHHQEDCIGKIELQFQLLENQLECAICTLDLQNNQQKRVLACCHQYHLACITQWIQKKRECPICSASILD